MNPTRRPSSPPEPILILFLWLLVTAGVALLYLLAIILRTLLVEGRIL